MDWHMFLNSAVTTLMELVLMLSIGLVGTTVAQSQSTAPQKSQGNDLERLRPNVRLGKVPAIAPGHDGGL